MTDKEKIRKEVQRLMGELIQEKKKGFGSDSDDACILELQNVLTYIDSLQEEPVSEDLEEAAVEAFKQIVDSDKNNFLEIFKAGAEWEKNQAMAEIQAQSMALAHGCPKENTSNDLKEAADNALESITDQYDIISVGSCLEMFRLGAEWQKAQEYACYEEAFEDGAEWKKQQMMAKAADMVVGYWMPNGLMLTVDETENCYDIDEGDRVKVIVIKEN